MSRGRLTPQDYKIAWICALPVPEWKASRILLDELHQDLYLGESAQHQYVYGSICGHNVVMGCLPDGHMGPLSAAAVANEMMLTFPSLRFALLVGVGGGVWSPVNDVRLGDVVVSYPDAKHGHPGGVVQYDAGTAIQGGRLRRTSTLQGPKTLLSSALGKVRSSPDDQFFPYFSNQIRGLGSHSFGKPAASDRLFPSSYIHVNDESTCENCDELMELQRSTRHASTPVVHYGTIASGNSVVRDAELRDRLAAEIGSQLMCFEMESAGILSQINCLVIRGICDYCDSHKNKQWQPYAAATAAAWAKSLLREIASEHVQGDSDAMSQHIIQHHIDSRTVTISTTSGAVSSTTDATEAQQAYQRLQEAGCNGTLAIRQLAVTQRDTEDYAMSSQDPMDVVQPQQTMADEPSRTASRDAPSRGRTRKKGAAYRDKKVKSAAADVSPGLVEERVIAYRMSINTLKQFLQKIFPDTPSFQIGEISIKRSQDYYTFRVPRRLTEDEKHRLMARRAMYDQSD